MKKTALSYLPLALLLGLVTISVLAAGGTFEIPWATASGGGAASGDGYAVESSVGQPGSGPASGGSYALQGGFSVIPFPSNFDKAGPANGSANQPITFDISWGSGSDADGYSYCYDTSNDDTCDTAWTSAGDDTSATLSGLSHGVTYFWQVRSMNVSGSAEADAGGWWNFRTASCHTLTTSVNPAGVGSVDADPLPNCTGSNYTFGTIVQLTATANPGYVFTGWSGNAIGSTNPILMTMDADKWVTANFTTFEIHLPLVIR